MTASGRNPAWGLLRARWLDVPVVTEIGPARVSWEVFSEGFERCLEGLSSHVRNRVASRECLESVVTEVMVDNLLLLVSPLGERTKLERLIAAAERAIARNAARVRVGSHGSGPARRARTGRSRLDCNDGAPETRTSWRGKRTSRRSRCSRRKGSLDAPSE